MHDFIEKPSRLILFAVSIIALVTIIILLSRSRLINLGGESLISGHGKLTASVTPTPAAVNTQEGNTNDTVTEEYEEVYIEDDEPVYEQDTWTEAEIDDQPAAEPVQAAAGQLWAVVWASVPVSERPVSAPVSERPEPVSA